CASSCKKDDAHKTAQTCNATAKTVKTIAGAAGIVYFNASLQQYVVSVHQPGTIDAVDMGVPCSSLPTNLQKDGTRVIVSGTFKEYGQAAPNPTPAGYTYYYLEVSAIQ
nr:hypothetical protein [Tanacetum cinerariifolium]